MKFNSTGRFNILVIYFLDTWMKLVLSNSTLVFITVFLYVVSLCSFDHKKKKLTVRNNELNIFNILKLCWPSCLCRLYWIQNKACGRVVVVTWLFIRIGFPHVSFNTVHTSQLAANVYTRTVRDMIMFIVPINIEQRKLFWNQAFVVLSSPVS